MKKLILIIALLCITSLGADDKKVQPTGLALLKQIDMSFPVLSGTLQVWMNNQKMDPNTLTVEKIEVFSKTKGYKNLLRATGEEWCAKNKKSMYCIDKDYLK